MIGERDELARDIFAADNFRMSTEQAHAEWAEWIKGGVDPKQNYCYEIADGLLAAGWSRPRVVSTVDELKNLPNDSVLRSSEGGVFQLDFGWWREVGTRDCMEAQEISLPATVLFEGAA